jgi:hypothetical protein
MNYLSKRQYLADFGYKNLNNVSKLSLRNAFFYVGVSFLLLAIFASAAGFVYKIVHSEFKNVNTVKNEQIKDNILSKGNLS